MFSFLKMRTRVQLLAQLVETVGISDGDDHNNVNKQKYKVWILIFGISQCFMCDGML